MFLKKSNFLFLGMFLFILSCQKNATKSGIEGHWLMHAVYQEGNDVSAEHNPEKDRYIIFTEDGSFETGGTPWGKNTGKYTYNEAENSLFLDSDAGEEDDSRWRTTLKKDTLIWQGVGTAWAEAFQIVNVRN